MVHFVYYIRYTITPELTNHNHTPSTDLHASIFIHSSESYCILIKLNASDSKPITPNKSSSSFSSPAPERLNSTGPDLLVLVSAPENPRSGTKRLVDMSCSMPAPYSFSATLVGR
ncbi:hypothetical protein E2C01_016904 [Portunus trituberculatus]|uniref:Uncharacterized protein n=1 Tax=Portunus trituberculatus TaxID=210409 RepID=A0A5B7DRR0_PORTR|nr:hypothetical protein [Portunus trituberculatus]